MECKKNSKKIQKLLLREKKTKTNNKNQNQKTKG